MLDRQPATHPKEHTEDVHTETEAYALEQGIAFLTQALEEHKRLLAARNRTLHQIHSSHGWKLLTYAYRLRNMLLPENSRRKRLAKWLFHRLLHLQRRLHRRRYLDGDECYIAPAVYQDWIQLHEPTADALNEQKQVHFVEQPKISLILDSFSARLADWENTLQSLRNQTYGHWKAWIILSFPTHQEIHHQLLAIARQDARIHIHIMDQPENATRQFPILPEQLTGEFVTFIGVRDTLAPFALFEIVQAINDYPAVDMIYADEDVIDKRKRQRRDPLFKPDWSPDTLRSYQYIGRPCVYRRELLERVASRRALGDEAGEYDLVLRASEQARHILHIPRVLYHRHEHSVVGTNAAARADQACREVLASHMRRCQLSGDIISGTVAGTYHVQYDWPQRPLVSIIIPNRDHVHILHRCMDSLARTSYQNHEVLIVENHSQQVETFHYYQELVKTPRCQLLEWDQPFNYSALNNFAAQHAQGEVLLFLNNDVEVIHPDWLERLLEHALRPDVGAVGAKLYYPDDTIQHAGVILGLGGIAGHAHQGKPRTALGYMRRLQVIQNVCCVTGACMMIRRPVFEEIGGFDEDLAIAFNDIDLCLRLRQKDYLVVWTPRARLYHHESRTRGAAETHLDYQEQLAREAHHFAAKWSTRLVMGDPYYNPNLSLVAGEEYRLNFQPSNEQLCKNW
ncbi:MAG: glycosyltransferase family 2 protein [Gemmataceae bacterium]